MPPSQWDTDAKVDISLGKVGECMFLFNRWVELSVCSDAVRFAQVIAKLEGEGISYETKSQELGAGARRTGNLGVNSRHGTLFQVFVKKRDLERARYAIR